MRLYLKQMGRLLIVSAFFSVVLASCGFNRYHQFVLPDKTAEESIEGWAVTLTLERHEIGVSQPTEEYTFIIKADPTPARRRSRLGIDSLEIYGPHGRALSTGESMLIFADEFTEIGPFERRKPGITLPTDIDSLTCRLHVTLLDSKAKKRWNRTIDYVFHSQWRKDFWIFKRE